MSPPDGPPDDDALRAAIARYRFYHIIRLNDRITTPGIEAHVASQQPVLKTLRSLDLADKRVLDVGCRDGLYSFEAEKLGAREIVGIDNSVSASATEFLIPYFRSKVRMMEMSLYDLRPESFGRFDVILFAGVLYHLRYPIHALRVLRDLMEDGGVLLLETAVIRDLEEHPLLYCPEGREGPYQDVTSVSFFNVRGLITVLRTLDIAVERHEYLHPVIEEKRELFQTVDRATLVCRFSRALRDGFRQDYWEGVYQRPR